MKKNIILGILACLLSLQGFAQNPNQMPKKAQRIDLSERWGNYERRQYFGIRFGMNVSQVMFYGPDVDNSSRLGLNGGIVAGFMLAKTAPIFLETGLLYQGKGAYINGGKKNEITIRQHFLEIPILFKYKIQTNVDNLKIQPFLGGFIAIGLGGETRFYHADPQFYPVDERGRYKRGTFSDGAFRAFDAGLKMGCGMSYRNLYVELSYTIGIMNAAQKEFNDFGFDNFDNSIHNGNFAITLGLDF